MGANPQQQYLDQAREDVLSTVKTSLQEARRLGKKAGKYRERAFNTQQEMQGFLGDDPASYYKRIQDEFFFHFVQTYVEVNILTCL